MTPMLYCNQPDLQNHTLVLSGAMDACLYVHCDPFHDTAADAIAARDWWLARPSRKRIVSLGWLGYEGFDIDRRDDNGVLVGCTQAEFDAGMAGRGFKMVRDLAKCREAQAIWKAAGVLPQVIHIDHEPTSTPDFRRPLPERARFDALRVTHFKAMLSASLLLPSATDIAIEFTQFSNNRRAWGVDYNGQRVPFNPVRDKFRSSTEMYSVDTTTTIKLAAWLAAVDDPSMPFLSAMNPDMLRDQLDLCGQRNATPFVYVDPAWNAVDWQMDRLEEALSVVG